MYMETGKVLSIKNNNNSSYFNFVSRPDGVGSVTHEEKEKFQEIKERLRVLLEHQITNFR